MELILGIYYNVYCRIIFVQLILEQFLLAYIYF